MRFTLPANSPSNDGRTYFLSPQMSRLRHSLPYPPPGDSNSDNAFCRSCADSLTVSTVWNGNSTRKGATRLPSASYFPSQISSVLFTANGCPPVMADLLHHQHEIAQR